MNEFDDVIALSVAEILGLEPDLLGHVHAAPPEKVDDLPAAIVAETDGDTQRDAYRGGWEATLTVRILLLAKLRGKEGIEAALRSARPWAKKLLLLFAAHDELTPDEADEPLGEIKTIRWKLRNITYAGTDYAGIELFLTVRVDWQIWVNSGPVGTIPT